MRFFIISSLSSCREGSAENNKRRGMRRFFLASCLILIGLHAKSTNASDTNETEELDLQTAINIVQKHDEWLSKSELTQRSFETLSEGANSLPDPSLSFNILNVPGDSFSINQEPITQLQLGASQRIPRGDTLELQEKKFKTIAAEQPLLRKDRLNNLALKTTLIWLATYEAEASYRLVEESRPLFSKLSELVSASYAASAGNAKQQDIIRAELEFIRLKDRLVQLETDKRAALADLRQYLLPKTDYQSGLLSTKKIVLPTELPKLSAKDHKVLKLLGDNASESFYPWISQHPLIEIFEKRIAGSTIDVNIAEQAYKPQFGLNASYAYRANDKLGNGRADLYSVGISVSMPLFSSAKIDADVKSSMIRTEAIRTEQRLLARELLSKLINAYARYKGASKRAEIYSLKILPQMSQQSDAAINAYTNDKGDFAEVVRAEIAQLDAKITLLKIEVSKRKALAEMNYFLPLEFKH